MVAVRGTGGGGGAEVRAQGIMGVPFLCIATVHKAQRAGVSIHTQWTCNEESRIEW